jgi:PAS domain S-box-containing protein
MNNFCDLNQLSKKELVERCLRLQNESKAKERSTTAWIEALTPVAFANQDTRKSLTKGLQLILEASEMDGGYIHVLNQKKHVLELRACLGLSERAEEALKTIREGERIPGRVLQKREALVAANFSEVSDISGKITQGRKQMLHAGFPLTWKGNPLGTLTVVSRRYKTLSERHASILKALSQFIGMILQNSTLFDIVSQGKQQWENAIDFVSDLIVICDGNFRITRINKAILDRFGLPLEDAIGKECFELLYDGQPLPLSKERLGRMLRKGVTFSEEVSSSRWGGIFSIAVSPVMTFGKLVRSIHVVREITQEKALEKDREQLAHKVALFAPGMITIDAEGRICSWDSGTKSILGYEEEEVKGKPLSTVFSSPEAETLFQRLRKEGGVLDFDTVPIAKGGDSIPVSPTASTSQNRGESQEQITLFVRTIRKQQKNGLILAQSVRSTAIREACANMSLKLGNRLEGLLTHIDRFDKGVSDPQDITAQLEQVVAHARSLQKILCQLHQFAEPSPRNKLKPLESARLIEGILEMIERKWSLLFRTRHIEFKINPDQRSLPPLQGDLPELLDVFDRLIENAVQAMPNGGEIVLRTRTDRHWVDFILIDDGVGMRSEETERVFDPLFTTHAENIGLGLSIVQGIILRHHGEVRLESSPSEGTRIVVSLPAVLDPPANNPPKSGLSPPNQQHSP